MAKTSHHANANDISLRRRRILIAASAAICVFALLQLGGDRAAARETAPKLRPPAAFAALRDPAARSRALFTEAGKVIMHARCVNCHPAGDRPLQADGAPHEPPVVRGPDGFGAVGMRCNTCHQVENFEPSTVPGHPKWHVAPLEMAWEGRSLGEICQQIKDPKRNGRLSLTQIHEHMAHDTLVGWAWNPGGARAAVPGTQAQFGELIHAWIESGAECPAP